MQIMIGLLFTCLFIHSVTSVKYPGVEGVLTESGLSFLNNRLQTLIDKRTVTGVTIPDHVEQTTDNKKYTFTNMVVESTSAIPTVRSQFSDGAIHITISRVALAIQGHWKYQREDWTHLEAEGNVGLTVVGGAVAMVLNPGSDWASQITCTASTGSIDMEFTGHFAWLYNILKRIFRPRVTTLVHHMMCDELQKVVIEFVGTTTTANRWDYVTPYFYQQLIYNMTIYDYSLITDDYAMFKVDGSFHWFDSPGASQLAPIFRSPTFWLDEETDQPMVLITYSQFTLNTLLHVAFDKNLFRYYLTKQHLGAVLDLKCQQRCVGKMLPAAIVGTHENSSMEVYIRSRAIPVSRLTSGSEPNVEVVFAGDLYLYLRSPLNEASFLALIQLTVTYTGRLLLQSSKIHVASVRKDELTINKIIMKNDTDPAISTRAAGQLFDGINRLFILKSFNELVSGIALSLPGNANLTNGRIKSKEGFLAIMGDIE